MPKAEEVFQLICFDFVCVRERGSTYYTEQDRTLADSDLFLEVLTMNYDNNKDNLLGSLRLDRDKLLLLQVQAEVRRAS